MNLYKTVVERVKPERSGLRSKLSSLSSKSSSDWGEVFASSPEHLKAEGAMSPGGLSNISSSTEAAWSYNRISSSPASVSALTHLHLLLPFHPCSTEPAFLADECLPVLLRSGVVSCSCHAWLAVGLHVSSLTSQLSWADPVQGWGLRCDAQSQCEGAFADENHMGAGRSGRIRHGGIRIAARIPPAGC